MPVEQVALSDEEMQAMELLAQLMGRKADNEFATEMFSEALGKRMLRKADSAVVLPFPVRSRA